MNDKTGPYKMPAANVGPCLWFPSLKDEPMPALITSVGYNAVNLSVVGEGNRGFLPRDGVRHVSDPDVTRNPMAMKSGLWDYTADQKAVQRLAEALGGADSEKKIPPK
jgi:hypothetical protein